MGVHMNTGRVLLLERLNVTLTEHARVFILEIYTPPSIILYHCLWNLELVDNQVALFPGLLLVGWLHDENTGGNIQWRRQDF